MATSRFPMTRRTAAALAFSAPLGLATAAGDDRGRHSGPGSLEAWWADLEKPEIEAARALLNLADRPGEAVAFLKGRMKPLKITAAEVRALLLKLGSENEKVWKPAFEELDYFDPRLAIDLETLMDRYKDAPGRQRMVQVLSAREAGGLDGKEVVLRKHGDYFNFFAPTIGSWWAEQKVDRLNNPHGWFTNKKKWIRAGCAIVLLEHIGTPDAVAIIKEMATGHPDAQPTRVAKDALARLGKTG